MDRVVADATGLSRSYVQKLISDGRLTADGLALKSNAIVQPGSELQLDVPAVVTPEIAPAPEIPVHVVYEDEHLLIVDKPSGLVVHPSPGHAADTLVNALLARADGSEYGGIAGVARPGIVHRLDRDTSGLLMVAKDDAAQASLMAQLKARRIKKTYLALVRGSVSAAAGRIEAPIGRDPKHRTRMAVVNDGRPSVTGYRVRERFDGWTLLELDLVTGRTHQIRVHLEAIGHPVAGRPGLRRGDLAARTRRPRAAVPARLAARAGGAVRRPPHPGDRAAPRRAGAGARIAPRPDGAGPLTVDPTSSTVPAPTEVVAGAPGAQLVIISGPSGVGKDTIIEALRDRPRDPDYHYVVTCTTRAPRPGEVDGISYHFLDRERFLALRDSGGLLEANEVHGNWYGTPRQEVRDALAEGHDVILKIDVQGAQQVKERVDEALLIFIVPPSMETLFGRLRARATESADELELRQRNAAIELARQEDYDHVVVNETGQVERTAQRIDEIVAETHGLHPTRRVRV